MLRLIEGNVLLKPSHRRQLQTWLKRVQRLGQRLGDFVLTLTLHRSGRCFEVKANVHDTIGDFHCRTRQHDWRSALQQIVRTVLQRLHEQCLLRQSRAVA